MWQIDVRQLRSLIWRKRSVSRASVILVGVAIGGALLFSAAQPARAASVCDSIAGALEIGSHTCQLTIVPASGTVTFTPPSHTIQLDAVLIAGGGAGFYQSSASPVSATPMYAYGGGGGEVLFTSLDTTMPATVSAGAGGVPNLSSGSSTVIMQGGISVTAHGGETITSADVRPASSGSGKAGFDSHQDDGNDPALYPGRFGGVAVIALPPPAGPAVSVPLSIPLRVRRARCSAWIPTASEAGVALPCFLGNGPLRTGQSLDVEVGPFYLVSVTGRPTQI